MKQRTCRISQKAIFLVIFTLLMICSLTLLYIVNVNIGFGFETQIQLILIYSVLSHVIMICGIKLVYKEFDIFTLFLMLAFVFNYGRHITYCFTDADLKSRLFNYPILQDSIIESSYVALIGTLAVYIGYVLTKKSKKNIKVTETTAKKVNEKLLRQIAWVVLFVSLPVYCYTCFEQIRYTMLYGYGYMVYNYSGNSLLILVGGFAFPATMLLIILRKKKEILPYILLGILAILNLVRGSRINIFTNFFAIGYFILRTTKLSIKRVLSICGIGGLLLLIFIVVSDNRGTFTQIDSIGDLFNVLSNIENPLFSILEETGITSLVLPTVMENTPDNVNYIYGYSYLFSIIYIIPNAITSHFMPDIPLTDEAFCNYLSPGSGIGSSFMAEAFYNFGYFSVLFIPLLGMIWGKLSNSFEKNMRINNKLGLFINIELIQVFVLLVRSDISYRLRDFVYYVGGILILYKLISMIRNKGKSRITKEVVTRNE